MIVCDIRVLLPFTSAPWTGGWGSWSNAPNDLATNRANLYNLKLGGEPYGASAMPYLNYTLHEFGHALGLSHEPERNDVEKQWVLHYFKTAKDIDQTKAENIYAAGYRNLDEIAGAGSRRAVARGDVWLPVRPQRLPRAARMPTPASSGS